MSQRMPQQSHSSRAHNVSYAIISTPVITEARGRSALASRDHEARYFVDAAGRQHFNFAQHVWLEAAVQMAYTRIQTLALETLAVNLLSMVTTERNYEAAVGFTSRRAIVLAGAFCAECLRDAPQDAWVLPLQSIQAWLASHRLRRRPRSV
jgi:hypothetical protein